ncbi:MAG: hypothetical protein A3E87_08425 [Gammaproteobacteria bacterium RIFCSPHIGHO2_12_FULL_35_23]|nr:MAG: hypothetical protein A3E87_08425 [Gammaproteobacteria bacterium RIFCSPHIGHO2_12_FULL_35_23]
MPQYTDLNIWKARLSPAKQLPTVFYAMLPLLASQLMQRLYYIFINRYIVHLGHEALLINSIQYTLITFGQFAGMATAISSLIFWKRNEYNDKQKTIFFIHLILPAIIVGIILLLVYPWLNRVLAFYQILPAYRQVALAYLRIGLLIVYIQTLYGGLSGMLIATNQTPKNMLLAVILLVGSISTGMLALFVNSHFPFLIIDSVRSPLMLFAYSNTILLLVVSLLAALFVYLKATGRGKVNLVEIGKIWSNETGVALIRSVSPIIYAFQLNMVNSVQSTLAVYQLALHVSYLLCLPLLITTQLALNDAAEAFSKKAGTSHKLWLQTLIYLGLIPSTILLFIAACFSSQLIQLVYNFQVSSNLIILLVLFFLACLIGQYGNALAVPIRAMKKNSIIVRNFFLAELLVNVGGTQILIELHQATPFKVGVVILLFTSTYFLSNLFALRKLTARTSL